MFSTVGGCRQSLGGGGTITTIEDIRSTVLMVSFHSTEHHSTTLIVPAPRRSTVLDSSRSTEEPRQHCTVVSWGDYNNTKLHQISVRGYFLYIYVSLTKTAKGNCHLLIFLAYKLNKFRLKVILHLKTFYLPTNTIFAQQS